MIDGVIPRKGVFLLCCHHQNIAHDGSFLTFSFGVFVAQRFGAK